MKATRKRKNRPKANQARRSRRDGRRIRAVTLLELLVAVLIIGILSTIASGVYFGQTDRARIAGTQSTIREISIAATRYALDTGQFPPSGTALTHVFDPATNTVTITRERQGSGLLHLSLVHSLSGDPNQPVPVTWDGPYIEFRASQLSTPTINPIPGQVQLLDSYSFPFQYVTNVDYGDINFSGTFVGTQMFDTTNGNNPKPTTAAVDLPADNPFWATETWYNPTTFQIYSFGKNGTTLADPNAGAENDDINNFGY